MATTKELLDASLDERRGATSASNAAADKLCPGRHLAQKGIPEEPKDTDAIHGTLIHEALAGDAEAFAKLTVEQKETYDACQKIEKAQVAIAFGAASDQCKVWRETRFWAQIQAT